MAECGCRILRSGRAPAERNVAIEDLFIGYCARHSEAHQATCRALEAEAERDRKEMALRGCVQLACDGDEVTQTVKGLRDLLHLIADRAGVALTPPEGT